MSTEFKYDYVVGSTPVMNDIIEKLKKISAHDISVLIEGESGTGKELVARAIHYNSPRKNNEFVVINCSAFSDTLLESELFGYLKGSFTGAMSEKKGLFEVADNGTFFLDEIADMSPALQVKLLRVIQEGTFLKIGSVEPIKVNVRILAATNKNLKSLVDDGGFREDLYYRINVTSIDLPPLRERKEDIELLCNHFLAEIAHHRDNQTFSITDGAIQLLINYYWPGNIRQLENEIERAAIFSHQGVIDESVLSPEIKNFEYVHAGEDEMSIENGQGLNDIKKRVVERIEKKVIMEGLDRTKWNKTECARLLKVSRGDLMRKISKYNITNH